MTQPDVTIANASVDVEFDVDTAHLRRAADAAANRFGVNFGRGIERSTNRSLARVTGLMDRWANDSRIRMEKKLNPKVKVDVDRNAIRRTLASINRDIDSFTHNLNTALRMFNFTGAANPFVIIGVAAAAAVPSVLSLASSIGQASFAATAAIPAMFGLAGAIIGLAGALKQPLSVFKLWGQIQDDVATKSGEATAAQRRFNQEMAKLSPAGREFTMTLIGMSTAFNRFSRNVLEPAVLPGFTRFLRDASTLTPLLSGFITHLAQQMGQLAVNAGRVVRNPLFQKSLAVIFKGNEVAFKALGQAAISLIQPLMTIGAAATPMLVEFAGWVQITAGRFARFTENARQTGQLAAFFQRTRDEFKLWAGIISDFGIGILNIFTLARDSGTSLAERLRVVAAEFRKWTETDTTQIRRFFEVMTQVDWIRVLQVVAALTALTVALRSLALVAAGLEIFAAIANPIGLVVVAVVALAAGFLVLYARVREFRAALDPWMQRAKDFIITQLMPAFRNLWNSVVELGRALKELGIDWQTVAFILGRTVLVVLFAITTSIKVLTAVIKSATAAVQFWGFIWNWLRNSVLQPFVNWMGSTVVPRISQGLRLINVAFVAVRNTVTSVFGVIVRTISSGLTQALRIASSFGRSFVNTFNAISTGVRNAINVVITILNRAIDLVNKILPGNLKIPRLGAVGTVQTAPTQQIFRGLASGGPVYGPGTGTSDSITVRLSNGEHVWTAQEVRNAGGHSAVEDLRAAARMGYFPGYAQGGAIDAILALGRKFGAGPPTSTLRWGDPGNHGRGLAVDFGGYNQDAAASRFLSVGGNLLELIHTTNRAFYGVKNGRRVGTDFYGSEVPLHRNHIHVAATPQGAAAALAGKGGFLGALGDLLGFFDPKEHLRNLLKTLRGPFNSALGAFAGQGMFGTVARAIMSKAFDGLIDFAAPKIPGADTFASPGGTGVERWRALVGQVLREIGVFSESNVNAVLQSIAQESGGNPNAVQGVRDINSITGDLAKGLNQVIGATFRAYAGKYVGRGQFDPYANIYASVRYAMSRYGARWASAMAAPGGYDNGGLLLPGQMGINTSSRPEAVFTSGQFRDIIEKDQDINITLIQHEDYVEAIISRNDKTSRRKFKAGVRK